MAQRFRRSRQKKMLWAPFGTGTQALAASGASSADLLSLIRITIPSINNFTVVRMRGFCFAGPVSPSADPKFYEVATVVVTQPAFDAGASPDPENDDASYSWRETIVWTPLMTRETAAGVFNASPMMLQVDMKAKRRIDQADNTFVFVIKNRQATASEFSIEGMILLDLR